MFNVYNLKGLKSVFSQLARKMIKKSSSVIIFVTIFNYKIMTSENFKLK